MPTDANPDQPQYETPEPKILQPRNGSKYHKREENARPGRWSRGEKKYRKSKTHTGKGTTLRTHRKGS